MSTIFDKIVSGEMKSWTVWQDDNYMAFLTPFPNTPGVTVVIPKENVGDYLFSLEDAEYDGLLQASRTVAKKLEKAFDTPRVAMIVEGTGVAHVHVKLIPLHGDLAGKTDVWSKHTEFNKEYRGYLSSAEGPKMDDEQLDRIQRKIIEAIL
jgi:diadenosine tetraphosphate (Ap4A) HIT family hydrolase